MLFSTGDIVALPTVGSEMTPCAKRLLTVSYLHVLYLSLTPAVAGYDQPTSTRAAFHGPTHGSAIGASQPLDHGSGTVCHCQPGFASPTTTSENFVGSWSHFCVIDTAAHSDYCSYAPVKYSYSLTLTHLPSNWLPIGCSWAWQQELWTCWHFPDIKLVKKSAAGGCVLW